MRLFKTPLFLALELSFIAICTHLLLLQSELIYALLLPFGYFLGWKIHRSFPKIESVFPRSHYSFILVIVVVCFLAVFNPHSNIQLDQIIANISILVISLFLGLRQSSKMKRENPPYFKFIFISTLVVGLTTLFLPPLILAILFLSIANLMEEKLTPIKLLILSGALFFSFYLKESDISRFFVQKFYIPNAQIKIKNQQKSFGRYYYIATSQQKKSEYSFHFLKKLSQEKKETYFQNRILREYTNDGQNISVGFLLNSMIKSKIETCLIWSSEIGHISTALEERCNWTYVFEKNHLQKKMSLDYFSQKSANPNNKKVWLSREELLEKLQTVDLVVLDDFDISFSEARHLKTSDTAIFTYYCNKNESCSLKGSPDKNWMQLQSQYNDTLYLKKNKGLHFLEAPLWHVVNFTN